MEVILMKNINKTPKEIENVNDNGNKWVRQWKIRFQKMTSVLQLTAGER